MSAQRVKNIVQDEGEFCFFSFPPYKSDKRVKLNGAFFLNE